MPLKFYPELVIYSKHDFQIYFQSRDALFGSACLNEKSCLVIITFKKKSWNGNLKMTFNLFLGM